MKSSKTWLVWSALALCAILVFGAMTWFTRSMLQSERERAVAEARADSQERMRLALWRMDSLGASLLLGEDGAAAGRLGTAIPVIRRFRATQGEVVWSERSSPDIPAPKVTEQDLRKISRAPAPAPEPPQESSYAPKDRIEQKSQDWANSSEKLSRSKAVESTLSRKQEIPAAKPRAQAEIAGADLAVPAEPKPVTLNTGPPRAGWLGGDLILVRQINSPKMAFDGAFVDHRALADLLLAEAKNLLPRARLLPATAISDDGLVLASFPFRLDAGPAPSVAFEIRPEIRNSLAVGWVAALLATTTAALLVFGVMRLSERRASFVSAVTHELRTPLTTFRLYSDMLESGAVKPEKRGDYLRVLSREADRLSHLVENVLAFSGIERGSARSVVATTRAAELLEPMRERLEARLASAGMSLELTFENPAEAVRGDRAAIEHILFNLIDNAAKYAAAGQPPVVGISTKTAGRFLEIHVADHGPGIASSERTRIFRAFHKSAREAAESQPGVGLGLALSRRLARSLGGDLSCGKSSPAGGARFILTLPVSRPD